MIIKVINKALKATFLCASFPIPLVNPAKTAVLAIGFIIAKKAIKTVNVCSNIVLISFKKVAYALRVGR
jgi:hypothetical protein